MMLFAILMLALAGSASILMYVSREIPSCPARASCVSPRFTRAAFSDIDAIEINSPLCGLTTMSGVYNSWMNNATPS